MEPITLITTIGGVCGAIATIIALITLIVKPLRNRFANWVNKTANTDEINKKFDDINDKFKDINDKIDKLTILVEKTIEQNVKLQEEMKTQSEALQASLRNSILKAYHCCMAKGYISTYQAQNVSALFTNYEKLGGNGFIKYTIMPAINRLPIKDNEGGD